MTGTALTAVWILFHITSVGGPLDLYRNVEIQAFNTKAACEDAIREINQEETKLQSDDPNRIVPIVKCVKTLVK